MPIQRSRREIRILIAEDEGLVATLTRSELESLGYKVIGIAPDGQSAVEMVRDLKPTVVVMDISMPVTDGIVAAQIIQQQYPTPVVILTAHHSSHLLGRATAAGVGSFVLKPPRADELARAIDISIARHEDLLELRRLNAELQRALADVKTLQGLLPICCGCKKIRDDRGEWSEVENYVMKRTEAKFSHGYCPTCLKHYFPEDA
jgi:two-component system, response regulator PdtaR